MPIKYWANDPEAWDLLVLAGETMPGVWNVSYTLKRDLDIKKSKGTNGARLTDHGYEATEITLTGRMTEQAEWEQLQAMVPKLHPNRPTDPRAPVTIAHPATDFARIGQIYIAQVGSPELDNGILTVRITGFEAVPKPSPVPKTKQAAESLQYIGRAHEQPPQALDRFPGYRGPIRDGY